MQKQKLQLTQKTKSLKNANKKPSRRLVTGTVSFAVLSEVGLEPPLSPRALAMAGFRQIRIALPP